jgi:hypothetical protein
MDIVIDTSALLAVIVAEPERDKIVTVAPGEKATDRLHVSGKISSDDRVVNQGHESVDIKNR